MVRAEQKCAASKTGDGGTSGSMRPESVAGEQCGRNMSGAQVNGDTSSSMRPESARNMPGKQVDGGTSGSMRPESVAGEQCGRNMSGAQVDGETSCSMGPETSSGPSVLRAELVKTPVSDLPVELVKMPVSHLPVGLVEMEECWSDQSVSVLTPCMAETDVVGTSNADTMGGQATKKFPAAWNIQKEGKEPTGKKSWDREARDEQNCAAKMKDVRAEQRCADEKEKSRVEKSCNTASRNESSQIDHSRRQENTRRLDMERKVSWSQMRKSRQYLLGQAGEWQDLTSTEARRLERDEKSLKSEIIKRKKSKYGKAGNSKLSPLEEAILSSQTRKKSELAEVKQNLGRKEAGKKGWKKETNPNRNIPEGRKKIEEHWLKLASSLRSIETLEKWVNAQWMENSSLEQQRGMAKGMEIDRGSQEEYSKRDGMFSEMEGNKEEMSRLAWRRRPASFQMSEN